MASLILLALQAVATAAGFAYFWRKQRAADAEIARLREQLASLAATQSIRPRRTAEGSALTLARTNIVPLTVAPGLGGNAPSAPSVAGKSKLAAYAETIRGIGLALAAVSPALGFAFGMDSGAVGAGLCAAAAMVLLGLRHDWSAAPWAGALTAAVWAIVGAVLQADALVLAASAALVGVTGLAYARLRALNLGSLIASAMALALLALATMHGAWSAYGAGFALLTGAAAVVGASTLRLEPLHIGAFCAALAGLFVFSGQAPAAIWFTPVAAMAGAAFLAIATIRVPQLGQRGAALAGVGALAPMVAAGALHDSQHGLANSFAAGGAFAFIAFALIGVLALAAERRGGLSALRLTLWTLALSAFTSVSAGLFIAFSAPLAGLGFACLSAGFAAASMRFDQMIWRLLAAAAALIACGEALLTASLALSESGAWPPWALTLVGVAAPSIALGVASVLARKANAPLTHDVLEGTAIALGVVAANVAIRVLFSGGALLLQPIGFVEAGAHIALWLAAALTVSASSRARLRHDISLMLGALAVAASFVGTILWFTPYWTGRETSNFHTPLGFLMPALLYWAHWVFWRARADTRPTRVALGAGAVSSAAYVILELIRQPEMPTWATAILCAALVSFAVAINFAPGVVAPESEVRRRRRHRRRIHTLA